MRSVDASLWQVFGKLNVRLFCIEKFALIQNQDYLLRLAKASRCINTFFNISYIFFYHNWIGQQLDPDFASTKVRNDLLV